MAPQIEVFAGVDHVSPDRELFPDGFRYAPELISQEDEVELLARISELPFREFEFHGYVAQRRVVSYGWHYDFSTRQAHPTEDIPDFLLELRDVAGQFANREEHDAAFRHVPQSPRDHERLEVDRQSGNTPYADYANRAD